jgi:WD40 repeat protein
VETGKELRRFEGHTGRVVSVVLSANGRQALTGSEDGTARLWDVDTGRELYRFDAQEHVWAVAFSPDGRRVLLGSPDTSLQLWELSSPAVGLKQLGEK